MKELVKTLVTEFDDKDYAHAYMEEFSNMAIAAQIKVLREQRGWTQKQLAEAAGMKQERVCALEDVDYDAWTVKTLRKLAKAFDLTVKVSFEKFSSGILDVSKISPETLKRTPRQEDMKEFSSNGYGHVETLWGNAVTTTSPISFLPIKKPINDIEYREPNKKAA
ncbi:helix-turn-helix transcriptional regulator [Methyloglobulus sp.]|uniref:helix-turn-helix transcriptional regulator n=1 Tax=Methyloglobulus sp. TaxID=2518622 RepID=UPI0032B7C3C4